MINLAMSKDCLEKCLDEESGNGAHSQLFGVSLGKAHCLAKCGDIEEGENWING